MADIKDPENTILLELKGGTVIIELLPDIAPKHAERMKEFVDSLTTAVDAMSKVTGSDGIKD